MPPRVRRTDSGLIVPEGDLSMDAIRRLATAPEVPGPMELTPSEQFRRLPPDVQKVALVFARRLTDEKPEVVLEAAQFMEIYPDVLPYLFTGELAQKLMHQMKNVLAGLRGEIWSVGNTLGSSSTPEQKVAQLRKKGENGKDTIESMQEYAGLFHNFMSSMEAVLYQKQEPLRTVNREGVERILHEAVGVTNLSIPESFMAGYRISVADELPSVEVNQRKLMLVLANVLTNAQHANTTANPDKPTKGVIDVTVDTVERDGRRYVRALIKDTGTGIDESDDKIGTLGHTTKPFGVGFGVAGSRMMLREIGGTLTLRNRTDSVKGAEAEILIPAA